MRKFKQAAKYGVGLLSVAVGSAHAALPAEVTTAMTDMKTDGLAVAGAFLLATIVIAALLVAKRGAKG